MQEEPVYHPPLTTHLAMLDMNFLQPILLPLLFSLHQAIEEQKSEIVWNSMPS
jgi:hypothetical protein